MMPVETGFGIVGTLLFVGLAYYSRGIVLNFREHQEVSLARFFIDERAINAFELLAVAAFIYSGAMVITGVEFLTGNRVLLYGSRVLILLVAGITIYVLREIYLVTVSPGNASD